MKTSRFAAYGLILTALSALGLADRAPAKPWWLAGQNVNEGDFLPPDSAFRLTVSADPAQLYLRWVIADGYYLYRSKIAIEAESPDLRVADPVLPPGASTHDAFFGNQEVYFQQLEARAPYTRSDYGAHPLQIKVTYQGCAMKGLCYPPIVKVLFPGSGTPAANPVPADNAAIPGLFHPSPGVHHWELVAILGGILAFFASGLKLRSERRLKERAP